MARTERLVAYRPPFDARPDVIDPTGTVAAWYTDPPGVIIQFTRPTRGTTELARWVVGPGNDALWRRFRDGSKVILVFDLSLMDGRDAEARALLHESARVNKERVARTIVIPPKGASSAYLSALRVATLLLKIIGFRVEIESSITYVIAECHMKSAGL
jgi:hypothetical protein